MPGPESCQNYSDLRKARWAAEGVLPACVLGLKAGTKDRGWPHRLHDLLAGVKARVGVRKPFDASSSGWDDFKNPFLLGITIPFFGVWRA